MSYTISYDASIKCKKTDVRGLLHHNARDVDMQNGIVMNHTNKSINSDYTAYNRTYFYNKRTGKFEECTDIKQIDDALQERLASVKRPLRKDAVVLRSLILQLDPTWYEEHEDEDEWKYSYECMIEWVCETFGKENIISYSIHEDETNPHIHVSFTPVTEDGRLSQKDFFDKFKLKEHHRTLREYMAEKGFDIEMKNRKPGKFAKRMGVDEYKDFAELQNEKEILDSSFRYNIKRRKELDARKNDLDSRDSALKAKEDDFYKRAREFTRVLKEQQSKLMEMANEYWNKAEDDSLVQFAKSVKNRDGISFYDVYQKRQLQEQARVRKELARRREILDHFESIARKAERQDYINQFEL